MDSYGLSNDGPWISPYPLTLTPHHVILFPDNIVCLFHL